jgi:hypothetical protein
MRFSLLRARTAKPSPNGLVWRKKATFFNSLWANEEMLGPGLVSGRLRGLGKWFRGLISPPVDAGGFSLAPGPLQFETRWSRNAQRRPTEYAG